MKTIVLLTTWGAPVGTEYFKRLSAIGGIRLYVIYERNSKLENEISRIYRERFGDQAPQFESAQKILPALKNSCFEVSSCNSEECLNILKDLKPFLLVLGGSGIVKSSVLAIPQLGTLNCHPGILPRYRGCTCVEWALYEDQPVGATVHFVTEEIDAGDIVRKEIMPIYQGDSYLDIRLRMFYFQAQLMERTVQELAGSQGQGMSQIEKFDWGKAQYYKPIPEELLKTVTEKIEQGKYPLALAKTV